MQAHTDDRTPARRSRFWAQPIARLARRQRSSGGAALPPVRPAEPLDEGDELLRRLREAGL